MSSLEDYWPPYALSITAGDLSLRLIRDDDLPELVELAVGGVHDPAFMPFSSPWTDADPADLPANTLRFHWSNRAELRPARFTLNFGVRHAGTLVGTQGFQTSDFAITRTGETGSWLGRRFQGQGIGTRMRQAVCAFAFDELGAEEITSGAFLDNPASLAVSRKVGYQLNGTDRLARRGASAGHQRLVLTPHTFIRGEPNEVTGAAELRAFLGLDGSLR